MSDPSIKVTRINDWWHARLFWPRDGSERAGTLLWEHATNQREGIKVICHDLLRWWDKMGFPYSKYADKARMRLVVSPPGPKYRWHLERKEH